MGHFKEIEFRCINIFFRIGSKKGRISLYHKILNDNNSIFLNRTSCSGEPPFRRISFSGSTVRETRNGGNVCEEMYKKHEKENPGMEGADRGGESATIQRGKEEPIQIKKVQRGRIAGNTETKGRNHTVGGSPTLKG